MKLYYAKGACSLVPRIIINELGLTMVTFESVNLKTKITASGENFLHINPKGSVPVLKLDQGEVLTENAVILQYLADQAKATQLLPNIAEFQRYRVLEWVNFITTELHKGFSVFFNPSIPDTLKNDIFKPLIFKKFDYVNQQLQNNYLMGSHFTLPDAYLFVILTWATLFKFDLNAWPNLHAYFQRLRDRKSIQLSLMQENS